MPRFRIKKIKEKPKIREQDPVLICEGGGNISPHVKEKIIQDLFSMKSSSDLPFISAKNKQMPIFVRIRKVDKDMKSSSQDFHMKRPVIDENKVLLLKMKCKRQKNKIKSLTEQIGRQAKKIEYLQRVIAELNALVQTDAERLANGTSRSKNKEPIAG